MSDIADKVQIQLAMPTDNNILSFTRREIVALCAFIGLISRAPSESSAADAFELADHFLGEQRLKVCIAQLQCKTVEQTAEKLGTTTALLREFCSHEPLPLYEQVAKALNTTMEKLAEAMGVPVEALDAPPVEEVVKVEGADAKVLQDIVNDTEPEPTPPNLRLVQDVAEGTT